VQGQDAPATRPAAAPAAPRTVYLWTSGGLENVAKQDTWGNGAVAVARDVTYDGASVLKITTRNFGEGARFDLKAPIDLTPYRTNGFLRFRLRFSEDESAPPVAGPMGGAGDPRRPGMGRPGGGRPGGDRPGGGRGGPGGFGGGRADLLIAPRPNVNTTGRPQIAPLPPLGRPGGGFGGEGIPGLDGDGEVFIPEGPPPQETPITTLQMTMVLEKGVLSGRLNIDLDKFKPDATGWSFFTMALKDMRATPDASGPFKRLIITGDNEDSFYLAQAALVIETGSMQVSIRRPSDPPGTQHAELTVKPGPLTLVADIEAGAADPEVEWNFDADKVGNLPPAPNQVEAAGGAAGGGAGGEGMGGEDGGDPRRPGAGMGNGGIGAGGEGAGGEGEAAPVFVGPRIDARGLVATFDYPNEEQNYRVEVTVRDRTGKKPDVVVSVLISVRG